MTAVEIQGRRSVGRRDRRDVPLEGEREGKSRRAQARVEAAAGKNSGSISHSLLFG